MRETDLLSRRLSRANFLQVSFLYRSGTLGSFSSAGLLLSGRWARYQLPLTLRHNLGDEVLAEVFPQLVHELDLGGPIIQTLDEALDGEQPGLDLELRGHDRDPRSLDGHIGPSWDLARHVRGRNARRRCALLNVLSSCLNRGRAPRCVGGICQHECMRGLVACARHFHGENISDVGKKTSLLDKIVGRKKCKVKTGAMCARKGVQQRRERRWRGGRESATPASKIRRDRDTSSDAPCPFSREIFNHNRNRCDVW